VDLRELLKNATPSDSEPEVAALLLHAFPRKDTARALPRQKKKKKKKRGGAAGEGRGEKRNKLEKASRNRSSAGLWE
jgi:hypothetical protein